MQLSDFKQISDIYVDQQRLLPARMKENQSETKKKEEKNNKKKKKRKPIRDSQRATKSKTQTLLDQLEFPQFSNRHRVLQNAHKTIMTI